MRVPLILLITLVIAACTPRLIALPDPTQIPPTVDLIPSNASVTPDTQADKMTALAIQDLSKRLRVDVKLVRALSVESTRWADTSLGCPRPGEAYAQQTVSGYEVRLEANGQEYVYHTDTTDAVVLCTDQELPSFPVTPGEINDGKPWMPVN